MIMTATTLIERENLKTALRELAQEEPDFLLELLEKAAIDKQGMSPIQKAERRKRIEALVKEDFEKYGEVFKALA